MGQIPMEKFLDLYALKHTEHASRKEKYKSAKKKFPQMGKLYRPHVPKNTHSQLGHFTLGFKRSAPHIILLLASEGESLWGQI